MKWLQNGNIQLCDESSLNFVQYDVYSPVSLLRLYNYSQLFPGRGYLQRDGRCSASHQEYELCSQRGSHPHFYQRLSRSLPIFLLLQTLKGKKCSSLTGFWHVPKTVLEKSAFHISMTITYVSVYQDHNFWLKTVAKRTQ